MAKKKCWVPRYPFVEERSGRWSRSDRQYHASTKKRYSGVHGPVGYISCWQDFLDKKRVAKETGKLFAFLDCGLPEPRASQGYSWVDSEGVDRGPGPYSAWPRKDDYPEPNWRIRSHGDYAFATEVRAQGGTFTQLDPKKVGTWGTGLWTVPRLNVRFKMGKEMWAGTVFNPNECHASAKYGPGAAPGHFHRVVLTKVEGRDYAAEYKARTSTKAGKVAMRKHWQETAEQRHEEVRRARANWLRYEAQRGL